MKAEDTSSSAIPPRPVAVANDSDSRTLLHCIDEAVRGGVRDEMRRIYRPLLNSMRHAFCAELRIELLLAGVLDPAAGLPVPEFWRVKSSATLARRLREIADELDPPGKERGTASTEYPPARAHAVSEASLPDGS